MTIPDDILAALGTDIVTAVRMATAANETTGRTGKFSVVGTVKIDKETGKRRVKARVQAGIPQGDDDTVTKKWPSVVLLTVECDHPGQQRIET